MTGFTTTVEDHLKNFRDRNGEQAWRAEVQRLALQALQTGSKKHEQFWRDLTRDCGWLDWDQLKQQAREVQTPPSADRLIAEALKSQLPALKSQAQYDSVTSALEATLLRLNAILAGDEAREQEARRALDSAVDTVRKVTELTEKLKDEPEAATSAAAEQFRQAPAQFQEVEVQAQLLQELAIISNLSDLGAWYNTTKDLRDRVVTQSLRNELMDAIRSKKHGLVW
jgi:hypothetical protein